MLSQGGGRMMLAIVLLASAIIVTNVTIFIHMRSTTVLRRRMDVFEFNRAVGIYDAPRWDLRKEAGK